MYGIRCPRCNQVSALKCNVAEGYLGRGTGQSRVWLILHLTGRETLKMVCLSERLPTDLSHLMFRPVSSQIEGAKVCKSQILYSRLQSASASK
jgi:hypothetical protein